MSGALMCLSFRNFKLFLFIGLSYCEGTLKLKFSYNLIQRQMILCLGRRKIVEIVNIQQTWMIDMTDTSESSSMHMGYNITSPEQTLQAAVEWKTEDFLSA